MKEQEFEEIYIAGPKFRPFKILMNNELGLISVLVPGCLQYLGFVLLNGAYDFAMRINHYRDVCPRC